MLYFKILIIMGLTNNEVLLEPVFWQAINKNWLIAVDSVWTEITRKCVEQEVE